MAENENDYPSLAWSLVPAAVGALANPYNRIGGAAVGLTSGLAHAYDSRQATDRLNADIIAKNAHIQQQQQVIDQAKIQNERQDRHWQVLENEITDNMKTRAIQRQQLQLEYDKASRDDKSKQAYLATIKDPAKRQLYIDNEPLYWKQQEEEFNDETALSTAARALGTYGLDKGIDARAFAQTMGKKTVQLWLLNEQKHRQEMQQIAGHQRTAGMNRYHAVYSPEQEGFFITDSQSQSITFKSNDQIGVSNPTLKDADRQKALNTMRQLYTSETKDAIDRPTFDKWLQEPQNDLQYKQLKREKLPEGLSYDMLRDSINRRQQEDYAGGYERFQKRWAETRGLKLGPDGKLSPEAQTEWDKYLTTDPKAKGYLAGWVDYEKAAGGRWNSGAPAPAPAAPAPAGKKPAGRPSLDSIFGQ